MWDGWIWLNSQSPGYFVTSTTTRTVSETVQERDKLTTDHLQRGPKNLAPLFQNYFTTRIRRKFVIILSPKIPPYLKCVAALPCEMSSVLKATIENKTTSVTTHFKKLTTGTTCLLSQLLSKVTVTSCSSYIKMFIVSSLLLDNALKPAAPLTNGTINGITSLSASHYHILCTVFDLNLILVHL